MQLSIDFKRVILTSAVCLLVIIVLSLISMMYDITYIIPLFFAVCLPLSNLDRLRVSTLEAILISVLSTYVLYCLSMVIGLFTWFLSDMSRELLGKDYIFESWSFSLIIFLLGFLTYLSSKMYILADSFRTKYHILILVAGVLLMKLIYYLASIGGISLFTFLKALFVYRNSASDFGIGMQICVLILSGIMLSTNLNLFPPKTEINDSKEK